MARFMAMAASELAMSSANNTRHYENKVITIAPNNGHR